MYENICRVCLKYVHTTLISVHTEIINNLTILQVLSELSSIEIEDIDVHPQIICQFCLDNLISFHSFRTLIIESYKKLKSESAIKQNTEIVDYQVKQEPELVIDETNWEENFNNIEQECVVGDTLLQKQSNLTQCDMCSAKFISKAKLKRHKTKLHKGKKNNQCSVCKKYFTSKSALKVHMRVHSGEKPFKCEVCGKLFRFSSGLRLHKRIHSKIKQHHCQVCNKGFHQAAQLQIHERTHTGEKPYMCATCGKTFGDPSSLKAHSTKHDPHQPCHVCGKYLSKRGLLTHMKMVHIANRSYACPECPKKFASKAVLAAHLRVHDGTTPFKCRLCGKAFKQHGTLYNHMRSHTGQVKIKTEVQVKREVEITVST